MPVIFGILALCVLLLIGYMIAQTAKEVVTVSKEDDAQQKAIVQQLQQLNQLVADLDKRLRNVEDIVTDVKFEDAPTTGREAINLKSEMNELKMMIKNLKS